MLIFELLDQYEGICRRAFFGCATKLNKTVLKTYRTDLLKITSLLVADAAFSVLPFVDGLKEIGFSLISRLRSNAVLYYIYEGPRTGKRGRPKTKDGKIDFSNPDKKQDDPT